MFVTAEGCREISRVPGEGHDRLLPVYGPPQVAGCGFDASADRGSDGIRPGHKVLEFVRGTGDLAILVKRFRPGVEVVGFGPRPESTRPRCPAPFEKGVERWVRT